MKKRVLILAILMLVCMVVLCACVNNEKKSEKTEGEKAISKKVPQEEIDKLVILANGATFRIDDKFDEVKEKLGTEIRPSQTYTPCGGSDDAQVTSHYYDGYYIDVSSDGIIFRAVISENENPGSKVTLAGIKLGDSPEDVKKAFNVKPDIADEYTINYELDKFIVSYGLNFEGNGNVNYISIDDISIAGV